jgi:hypothetical protein
MAQSALTAPPGAACMSTPDPAAFHAIDWAALVVHPSAEGDRVYTSPAQDPALRWSAEQRTDAGRAAWTAAIRDALTPSDVPSGPFAALAAFQRAASLVSKQRTPASPAEQELLSSLPSSADTALIVAIAHEDESSGLPADYAVQFASGGSTLLTSLTVPALEPGAAAPVCTFGTQPAPTRLGEWLLAQQADFWASWPCTGLSLDVGLISDFACDGGCVNWRPIEDGDGSAECIVRIETGAAECDPQIGWLDPLGSDGVRRAEVTTTSSGTQRTCEIQQLTGSALQSCQQSLECRECSPGWCVTQVAEILDSGCANGRKIPLRFVGGSDGPEQGLATITCNVTRVP